MLKEGARGREGMVREGCEGEARTHRRMICSMALGGKRPLMTMREEASIEPVVPISASMNE